MPEYATFHNTILDRKCSKCKKTQDNIYFQQNGKVYKTCNECRDRAQTRRGDRFRNNLTTVFSSRAYHAGLYNDSDDGSAVNPVDALIALGFNYNDMQAGLSMSSSSAAAADYFVDEPEPEPEPDES